MEQPDRKAVVTSRANEPDPIETHPDVLEQRQRLDGTYEVEDGPPVTADRSLSPDEVEQLQEVDGRLGTDRWAEVPTDGPASPDVLDQRREAEPSDDDPPGAD